MKKLKQFRFPAPLFTALMTLFHEWMIHIWVNDSVLPGRLLAVTLFGMALGCLLGFVISLLPQKGQKWFAAGVSLLLTVIYLGEYFMNDAYQCFMSPVTILTSAGNVATDFGSLVVSVVLRNHWRIGLFLLPVLLYVLFTHPTPSGWKTRTLLGTGGAGMYLLAFLVVQWIGADAQLLSNTYNFDRAVRCFGLNPALVLELTRGTSNADQNFAIPEAMPTLNPTISTVPENTDETIPSTDSAVVYGDHVLDLDFTALAESEPKQSIAAIHSYIASLTPAKENEYTGLFKGKNLIFITAEAFAAEVIDPELTPTLFRLANEGIRFTDYYQPLWGGSTSTGEFSNLLGLVASGGTASILEATQQDMFLTIGRQLQKEGYFSAAYHNHSYTYYDRHKTHTALGYDSFTGLGNGLEQGVQEQWPQSDLEMMEFTVPQYINHQPFSVYYMTVSGHCLYHTDGNAMSRKNFDAVDHLDIERTLKGYFAAQLELEYALTHLMNELEKAGILNDTVIVLGTDHYPYGLEQSSTWMNSQNYLAQLYGYTPTNQFERDHSALIIWSGCLEDMDLVVDDPVYSLDILPTLSNLFGVEYDSRLLVGRDVLSDEIPIILWPNYAWKTDKGTYDAEYGRFIPAEGQEVSEEYIAYISSIVFNKITYSRSVSSLDYFNYVSAALNQE